MRWPTNIGPRGVRFTLASHPRQDSENRPTGRNGKIGRMQNGSLISPSPADSRPASQHGCAPPRTSQKLSLARLYPTYAICNPMQDGTPIVVGPAAARIYLNHRSIKSTLFASCLSAMREPSKTSSRLIRRSACQLSAATTRRRPTSESSGTASLAANDELWTVNGLRIRGNDQIRRSSTAWHDTSDDPAAIKRGGSTWQRSFACGQRG